MMNARVIRVSLNGLALLVPTITYNCRLLSTNTVITICTAGRAVRARLTYLL